MKRRSLRLLLLAAALIASAVAKDQDLVMDARAGSMVVSGSPSLAKVSDKLQTSRPKPAYLALYTDDGQASDRCELKDGSKVELLKATSVYLDVVVSTQYLTVNRYQGTFVSIVGEDQYDSWNLEGYIPGYEFRVTGPGAADCASLGTTFKGKYLRISADATTVVSPAGTRQDDPPIPIIGGSLKFYAPERVTPSCTKPETNTATIPGVSRVLRLEKTRKGLPAERYILLDGLKDWRITAYPQQLEITPGSSGMLLFSVPLPGILHCGSDVGGEYLEVKDSTSRPQQFVVDWSTGWFSARRSLQVPCGTCRLRLITRRQ